MKKYELIRIIGDGTYGVVYEGINRETKQKVAVKKLKERYKSLKECLSKIEVKVLEKLNHENIVQLKEVIREKNGEVSYIFEYCDCNLFEFIENHREHKKRIPEPIIREIIQQITRGMKYMHSKQYFHRDLKPENILVILNKYNLNNIIPGELQIKICDFGTAKKIPVKNILPMTDYVCTRWYRPPECVLRADIYDEKMDIWAIGCVMAELYNLGAIFPGENEFDQLNQILKILGTPTREKWPWGYKQSELFGIQLPTYYKKDFKKILGYISKEGVNLLNEIFTFDSAKRPSCSKILNHPYFKVIPKPKISINSNSLRSLHKQNNLIINNNNEESNRTNNNSKNKNNMNKNNISILIKQIGNNTNEKRIVTKKISNNDIIENYLNSTVRNKDVINAINLNNNNNNENKKYISNTGKKDNDSKYIKINETKSGLVTKKILKYNKNGQKSNNEENKNNNNNYKKELIIRRIELIGRNGANFNTFDNIKKLSFVLNSKTQDKSNINEISTYYINNLRNTVSSNKKNKEENKQNNSNNKKYNNYKIVDIVSNNNHKEHYIKYNKTNTNTNRRNNKSNSKLLSFGKNNERNSNANSKLLLRTKNINSYRNKNNNKKNHKFYISKGNKHNSVNPKYLIYNNCRTYNENPNNSKRHNHSHNHNNICICSYERNYSAKRNIINSYNEYRQINKNANNIKHLDDNYKNNITPKNNKDNNNFKSYKKSPAKKDEKIGSLLTYFFNSRNNVKNLFEKSKSLIKYKNNNSSVNINFKKDYKDDNNNNRNNGEKIRIKNMNVEIYDGISKYNYYHNNERNYIYNSTSKTDCYRNTKN